MNLPLDLSSVKLSYQMAIDSLSQDEKALSYVTGRASNLFADVSESLFIKDFLFLDSLSNNLKNLVTGVMFKVKLLISDSTRNFRQEYFRKI